MTETRTATLAEFLLARIAEDEAVARGADQMYGPDDKYWGYELGVQLRLDDPMAIHADKFGPTRVLAECEAKRRIVDEHRIGFDPCDAHDPSFESIPCDTVRLLALPYADHPDYREEWRV